MSCSDSGCTTTVIISFLRSPFLNAFIWRYEILLGVAGDVRRLGHLREPIQPMTGLALQRLLPAGRDVSRRRIPTMHGGRAKVRWRSAASILSPRPAKRGEGGERKARAGRGARKEKSPLPAASRRPSPASGRGERRAVQQLRRITFRHTRCDRAHRRDRPTPGSIRRAVARHRPACRDIRRSR